MRNDDNEIKKYVEIYNTAKKKDDLEKMQQAVGVLEYLGINYIELLKYGLYFSCKDYNQAVAWLQKCEQKGLF